MIQYIKSKLIYKLFKHDLNYNLQESIPLERKLQYLFLVLIHKLQICTVIKFLNGNQTAIFRYTSTILNKCKYILDIDLLLELEKVLNNHNSTRFFSYASAT